MAGATETRQPGQHQDHRDDDGLLAAPATWLMRPRAEEQDQLVVAAWEQQGRQRVPRATPGLIDPTWQSIASRVGGTRAAAMRGCCDRGAGDEGDE